MMHTRNTRAAQAAWLIATLLGPAANAHSSSVGGTELEVRELAAMSPEAAALVANAEHVLSTGSPGAAKEAWSFYARAWALAPRSPVPGRGICRLMLALGITTAQQRRAATGACHQALFLGGTPEDIRNDVGSLIDGDPPPTMEDLVSASVAAEGAARLAPGQPWGPAARGDLALRLGDRELLDASVAELGQIAPDHRETRRLIALAAASSTRWSWVGRLAVVLIFIITIAHAARGRLARRRTLIAVLAGALMLLGATSARAQSDPVRIDDAHPERSVPTAAQQMADPLGFGNILMELGGRAEAAAGRRDFAAAARYYAALAKAAPDRSYALSRLCDSLDAVGNRDEAIAACGAALSRQGTVAGDFTHFVRLLLAKDAPLTREERHQADVAIAALEREPRAALIATRVRCNVAVHEHDVPGLQACTAKLVAAAPSDPSTIRFQWALAIEKKDRAGAEALAARAAAAGLDADTGAWLRRATLGGRPYRRARALRWGLEAGLAFLIAALGVGAVVRYVERARRRTVLS
jgi:tetratricopeptide (TPR) repeat protein